MTRFDIKAASFHSGINKPLIITFFQLLPLTHTIEVDHFECHPNLNSVVGLLSSSLGKLFVLEIRSKDQEIDFLTLKDPIYDVDLSKVDFV